MLQTPMRTACRPSPMRALWGLDALRRGEDRGSYRTWARRLAAVWAPAVAVAWDASIGLGLMLRWGEVGGGDRRWEEG